MAVLTLRILGDFEARRSTGEVAEIPIRKGQALLAFLALNPGEVVARFKLAGLLWGDRGNKQARTSLRQTLTVLRKALKPMQDQVLRADRQSIGLDGAGLEVDAVSFQDLIASGTPADLETAVSLYRGDLLDGLDLPDPGFQAWLVDERRRFHDLMAGALNALMAHKRADGAPQEAIVLAQRLLTLDPLREDVHRALMVLYAELGQRHAAQQQYQRCRELLASELDVEPEAETEALYQTLRNNDAAGDDAAGPSVAAPTIGTPNSALTTKPPLLPGKPSVAVLSFEELSGDPGRASLGEGLAADINTELFRLGMISVVGHHEAQYYALESATVQEVGRNLAVRYVLCGTVRRADQRVRITVELLEVETGRPCWSERYDRQLDDLFAVQDEIASAIVGVVEPSLHRAEFDRVNRNPPEDMLANELVLRAWKSSNEGSEEGNRAGERYCEDALLLDPEISVAYSQLAWNLWYTALNGWTDDREIALRRAVDRANRASSLNPKDYDAVGARGFALIGMGNYDGATRVVEELAKKFPSHAHSTLYRSGLLNSLGQHQEALELAEQSVKIDPHHGHWFTWALKGRCLFCLERYAEAIDALELFMTLSKFPGFRLVLAAAYAAAGRDEDARTEVESLGADAWKLTAGVYIHFRDPADRERLAIWSQRAGLPE